MAEKTEISWCNHTWSPVWGCTEVSPACDNCYARTLANRFGYGWNGAPMREFGEHHWNEPLRWNRRAAKAGVRARVFPSMCDPFDKDWPRGVRERFFDLIVQTPHLTWLLLTKRIGNAERMISEAFRHRVDGGPALPLQNVWIGATVINQAEADRDIPKLLAVPARVRFLSIEPMLGPMDLRLSLTSVSDRLRVASEVEQFGIARRQDRSDWLHWVICGGESGPKARPMHPDWARSLRDQCAGAGVAFHFKQWGEWGPTWHEANAHRGLAWAMDNHDPAGVRAIAGERVVVARRPDGRVTEALWPIQRHGKAAAGRLLDGRTHDEFPKVAGEPAAQLTKGE